MFNVQASMGEPEWASPSMEKMIAEAWTRAGASAHHLFQHSSAAIAAAARTVQKASPPQCGFA